MIEGTISASRPQYIYEVTIRFCVWGGRVSIQPLKQHRAISGGYTRSVPSTGVERVRCTMRSSNIRCQGGERINLCSAWNSKLCIGVRFAEVSMCTLRTTLKFTYKYSVDRCLQAHWILLLLPEANIRSQLQSISRPSTHSYPPLRGISVI